MTQSQSQQTPAAAETPPSLGRWLVYNGPTLAIVLGLLVYLYIQFDWYGLFAIGKAALGLSFVIFIHELGHFLAAKWCDVHVTTFSIGFGPAVPGCSFQRGETTYKLGLLPLGGYVQMVGQVDGDEGSDDSEDDPRSYRNKGVGQRMLIISAGVIMNVILAIICFVIVFLGPGKDELAGVVQDVDSGSAAFQHGVRTEAEIIQIGDAQRPNFEELVDVVTNGGQGQEIPFIYKRPQDPQPVELRIEPRKGEDDLKPMLGIGFPGRLELQTRTQLDKSMKGPVARGSVAGQATPAFEWGDKIVAMTDPATGQVTDLPDDPRNPGKGQKDFFAYWQRMVDLCGKDLKIKEVTIVVERRGDRQSIKVPRSFHQSLGVRMQMGPITEIRRQSAAALAKVQLPSVVQEGNERKSREGDVIEKVRVKDADGKVLTWTKENLDPMRLPFELRQWADGLEKAKKMAPAAWLVTIDLHRHSHLSVREDEKVEVQLAWDQGWKYDRINPLNRESPLAIPELGLGYRVKTTVAGVDASLVQDNPLQPADVIKEVRLTTIGADGTETKDSWVKLKPGQWAWFAANSLSMTNNIKSIGLKVDRDKNDKDKEIEIVPVADPSWPSPEQGLVFQKDFRRVKADNILHAVEMGLSRTHRNVVRVFQNIRNMFTGRVSVKMLSGPISIARFAYLFALVDSWEFVFFLGMISINLAVINFLPIPVLDGGHMVFLIYEKLRGKPASEGIRIFATYVGLALILCLMVFVFYLDILRLF